MLDIDQLKTVFLKVFPNCKKSNEFISEIYEECEKFDINTNDRISAFLAQCGHETCGFTVFSENLNYSAKALNQVFPKYFKNAGIDPNDYARQPEKIANHVYANRMGNSNEASGDGWKYRGRGIIQLTGKSNYKSFNNFLLEYNYLFDVLERPEYITQNTQICVLTGIWFWDKHNLNYYADSGDMQAITKIINGGLNGYEDRMNYYTKIKKILEN